MILKNGKRIDGCSDTVPIGTLNPFLGSTAPYGYLLCQGQKVSKTTYKELYEICGDTFGQSTDTEFYLPDLRGQTIAGYKEGDYTFGTLGGLIGSLTHLHSTGNHTLTIDEMPSHSHNDGKQDTGITAPTGGSTSAVIHWDSASCKLSTTSTGGSQPHNHGDTSSASSIQPTIVLNWIVKAFQLMPNQSYVSTIGQDSDINTYSCNYINKLKTYSTKEQVVGTWVDEKPIYRKVVRGISPTTKIATMWSSNSLPNIDTCINIYGMIHAPNDAGETTLWVRDCCINAFDVNVSEAGIACSVNNEKYFGLDMFVVVEYTKTTD